MAMNIQIQIQFIYQKQKLIHVQAYKWLFTAKETEESDNIDNLCHRCSATTSRLQKLRKPNELSRLLKVRKRNSFSIVTERLDNGSRSSEFQRKRCGFCPPDLLIFDQLLEEDQQLCNKLCKNTDYCLHSLLPALSTAAQHYPLRQRAHNRDIPERTGHLTNWNFLTRLIQKDTTYWITLLYCQHSEHWNYSHHICNNCILSTRLA